MKIKFQKSKALSLILCVVLIISSLPVMSASAEVLLTEDGFRYVIENDEVEIEGYEGSEKEVVIPSKINGLPVTKLRYAFQFRNITSVVIPGSVKSIAMYCFQYCKKLTSVVMENGVESIGDSAFIGCTSLTSITIPESVINIEREAFVDTGYYNDKNNWNGNELYIGSALINADATKGDNYVIKPGTTVIGAKAFKGTTFTGVIDMPDSVRGISEYAFDSSSVTTVNFSSNLTHIGRYAFYYCRKLKSITLPQSLKSINTGAFDSCVYLTSVTIPKNVTYIASFPFQNCVNLAEINVDSANKQYASINGVLYNKNITTLIEYPSGKKDESFVIPDTVTNISDWCLTDCKYIVSVTIPDSVKNIGTYFMYRCENLVSANIPAGLEVIPDGMLSFCDKLAYVNIPASVTAIDDDALKSCYSVKEFKVDSKNKNFASVNGVLFNKDITTLIVYPAGKKNAEYIVPDTVTTISEDAFKFCEHIIAVKIPSSVKTIGNNAFNFCRNLYEVTLSEGLTTIENYAFTDCVKLFNINIPDTVTSVGIGSFKRCNSLAYATLPKGLTTIEDDVFIDCENLLNINIPSTVTSIGDGAFNGCKSLKYINIPKGVTSIGDDAFNEGEGLWHVLYGGKSVTEWNSIDIGENNTCLTDVYRHYSTTEKMIVCNVTKAPDCINSGSAYYGCVICSDKKEFELMPTGHTFSNGGCTDCDIFSWCQSKHPYEGSTDQTWVIYGKKAKSISLTFSSDTETQEGNDYIYIYNEYNGRVGRYSGTELANKTITVKGDTCKIQLVSDKGQNYYGFRLVKVEADYEGVELGDVNGDGEISISDVTNIQFAISKQITFNEEQQKAADTDKDGVLSVNDVTTLQFYLAKIITEL